MTHNSRTFNIESETASITDDSGDNSTGVDIKTSVVDNKGVLPSKSLRRDSSSAYLLRLQNEFTVNKLQFSSLGLYGREKEQELLLSVLGRVIANNKAFRGRHHEETGESQSLSFQRELVWVKGVSGCGKSRLVDEVLNNGARKRQAIYARGKFDMNNQQGSNVDPYSAIATACGELCHQILNHISMEESAPASREDESELLSLPDQIKEKLTKDIGEEQVRTLTRIFPVLTQIIGPNNEGITEREEEPGTRHSHHDHGETKNRFQFAFRRFLTIIGSFFPCIVFVLDDVQWADDSSMELFQLLIADNENPSLLLVACYRSDEVDQKSLMHRLLPTDTGGVSTVNNSEVSVTNLSLDDVKDMLMDLLGTDESAISGLAEICFKKTLGNPFFLKSFLLTLQDQLLLQFNLGLMRWIWDEKDIVAKTQVSGNVVDLLSHRMEKLDSSVQTFLAIAACLGKSFSGFLLTRVWDIIQSDTDDSSAPPSLEDVLAVSLNAGFIEKTSDESYRWVHDKVQESATSLITADELCSLQSRIGGILVTVLNGADFDTHVFIAVNLLNQGPTRESTMQAKYNLSAANKAIELSAIDSAAKYACTGIGCLPSNCWTDERQLCLELYSIAAEAEGYVGRIEAMQTHCEVVLSQKIDLIEKLRVYNVLLDSFATRGKMSEAYNMCQSVLAELGCKFAKSKIVRAARIFRGLRRLRKATKYRIATSLSNAPVMKERSRIEIMKLLEKLATYSYLMSDWSLYILVVLKEVELTDRYGLSEQAAHAFGTAGLVFCAFLGEFQIGSIYGVHALRVLDKIKFKRMVAQCKFVVYSFVLHWTQSAHLIMQPIFEAYTAGIRAGDIEYAMYSVHCFLLCALQSGRLLDVIEADCKTYTKQMAEHKRHHPLVNCSLIWQLVLNLIGRCEDRLILSGEALNEEEMKSNADPFQLCLLRAKYQILYAIYDRHDLGAKLALSSEETLTKKFPGSSLVVLDTFYRGASLFAMAQRTRKRKFLKQGVKILTIIRKWAESGNHNVRHYKALLEAELAVYNRKTHVAKMNFETAIALSRGRLHDAAFAHERYAVFLFGCDPAEANFRIGQATSLYREWGAHGKIVSLREKYSEVSEVPSEAAYLAPLKSEMLQIEWTG